MRNKEKKKKKTYDNYLIFLLKERERKINRLKNPTTHGCSWVRGSPCASARRPAEPRGAEPGRRREERWCGTARQAPGAQGPFRGIEKSLQQQRRRAGGRCHPRAAPLPRLSPPSPAPPPCKLFPPKRRPRSAPVGGAEGRARNGGRGGRRQGGAASGRALGFPDHPFLSPPAHLLPPSLLSSLPLSLPLLQN